MASQKPMAKSYRWIQQFCSVIILISTLMFTSVQTSNRVNDLILPALGRTAKLGNLYDERSDQFRSSVFRADVPATLITSTDKPYTFAETAITNTMQEKFKLLKLSATIQASILSGLFTVSGSASYLNEDKTTSNEVLGNLLLKHETCVEQLQLFYDEIGPLYKVELLRDDSATHIVSSIKWGANVAVSFRDRNTNNEAQEDVSGKLSVEFKLLQGFLDIKGSAEVDLKSTSSHSISNYSVLVHGDIDVPSEMPTNYHQIKEYISKIPSSIQKTNGGKGVPLEYTLTPIARVNDMMQISQKDAENQFAQQLDESILVSCLDIFEEISKIQQVLNELNIELESYPECVAYATMDTFKNLKYNFTTSKLRFMADFKDTLIKVRSGSLPISAMGQLAAQVERILSGNNVNTMIRQLFGEAKGKISLCRVFAKAHTDSGVHTPIEYFGSRQRLLNERIQENRRKPVYILLQKYEHIQMFTEEWNDNRNTLLHILNRPYNKLLVVDCDFDYSYCTNITKPIIRQFKKGKMLIEDVTAELKKSYLSKVEALKIQALGRFAEIGELYDARTDTFLEESLLPHNYPDSLVRLTKKVNSAAPQIKDISSEGLTEKMQALNVNSKDQQFSILARLLPLKRSAKYFEFGAEDRRTRMRSMAQTLVLNEEQILLGPKLEAIVQPNVLDRVQATHFVLKRSLGFTSVFTIEEGRIPNGTSTVQNDEEISNTFNQMKAMIIASQQSKNQSVLVQSPSPNVLDLADNYKIKIYSDTQREDSQPTIIKTKAALSDHLFQQLYPQQTTQNGGKGQPIAYELYPIQNLASEFGILGLNIPYNSLTSTTEDPATYLHYSKQAATAETQIKTMDEEMKRNRDCTTDMDHWQMSTIKETFKTTLGAFKRNFSNTVKQIKNCEFELDALQNFRTEFETKNYFGHGAQYKELDKLSSYTAKLNMVNRLRHSGITYIGRENGDVTFNMIFENRDASRTYVLFYKPEWTLGTKGDAWRRLSYFFFGGASSSQESASADADVRRFVVDCGFEHAYCNGLNQAAIYKNSRGILVPYNSTTTESEGGDNETGDDIFSSSKKISLNVTLQNALRNYDAQLRIMDQKLQCVANPCLNGVRCTFKNDERHCECPAEFLGNDCEYRNECVYPGSCRALSTLSSETKCKCQAGYAPDPQDNRRCEPVNKNLNENATLIFENSGSIEQFLLSQETVTRIQNHSGVGAALDSLDVMYRTNTMFWSDRNGNINTALIREGAAKIVVLNDSGSHILSLAVDWVYGHLYFADINRGAISVANLDGSIKKVLFNTGVPHPIAIVVDPLSGWMYWADHIAKNIERAAMDGSKREVIANTYSKYPRGLALDMTQNRLYWITDNFIYSMNVDGSDQKLVYQATHPTFSNSILWSITTFGDFVIWREYYTQAIYRTNKCGGRGATKIHSIPDQYGALMNLQVHHFSKQPEGVNYCENRIGGQCSHLCLRIPPTPNKYEATKCACPDGRTLSSDERTCT